MWQPDRHEKQLDWLCVTDGQTKKMRGGVFSKNILEGASERRNENIIVSGTLKIPSPIS